MTCGRCAFVCARVGPFCLAFSHTLVLGPNPSARILALRAAQQHPVSPPVFVGFRFFQGTSASAISE